MYMSRHLTKKNYKKKFNQTMKAKLKRTIGGSNWQARLKASASNLGNRASAGLKSMNLGARASSLSNRMGTSLSKFKEARRQAGNTRAQRLLNKTPRTADSPAVPPPPENSAAALEAKADELSKEIQRHKDIGLADNASDKEMMVYARQGASLVDRERAARREAIEAKAAEAYAAKAAEAAAAAAVVPLGSKENEILTNESEYDLAKAKGEEKAAEIDEQKLEEKHNNKNKNKDELSHYLNIAQKLLINPNVTQEMLINSIQPYNMLGPMRMTPYLPQQLQEAEQLINILKILDWNIKNPQMY
jgi:hypothetical protein